MRNRWAYNGRHFRRGEQILLLPMDRYYQWLNHKTIAISWLWRHLYTLHKVMSPDLHQNFHNVSGIHYSQEVPDPGSCKNNNDVP